MVTSIHMERADLITKEQVEKYCKGEDPERCGRIISANDDLASFFEDCRLGKELDYEFSYSFGYFFPKLTEEEMELVETKDKSYLKTFTSSNPDVPEEEMMISEADSKFVRGKYTPIRMTWNVN